MASWKNATTTQAKGVLRPAETAAAANLDRDHPVSPELEPFVERYWSVRWDLPAGESFRAEVLSHPSVNVSVESGTHDRFGHALPAVLVHGVVKRRFEVDLVGAGRVAAVKFRPGGWTAFTGARPEPGRVRRLGAELRTGAGDLLDAVLAEQSDTDRTRVLDAYLAAVAPAPPAPYVELCAVLDEMLADRSLVRVDDVARRCATSVRSLQRLFAAYVGVGPKAVLARYRLHDAVAAIDAGAVDDLAALAASLGWFDQAHFSREFRDVVGTTPSAYLHRATG